MRLAPTVLVCSAFPTGEMTGPTFDPGRCPQKDSAFHPLLRQRRAQVGHQPENSPFRDASVVRVHVSRMVCGGKGTRVLPNSRTAAWREDLVACRGPADISVRLGHGPRTPSLSAEGRARVVETATFHCLWRSWRSSDRRKTGPNLADATGKRTRFHSSIPRGGFKHGTTFAVG